MDNGATLTQLQRLLSLAQGVRDDQDLCSVNEARSAAYMMTSIAKKRGLRITFGGLGGDQSQVEQLRTELALVRAMNAESTARADQYHRNYRAAVQERDTIKQNLVDTRAELTATRKVAAEMRQLAVAGEKAAKEHRAMMEKMAAMEAEMAQLREAAEELEAIRAKVTGMVDEEPAQPKASVESRRQYRCGCCGGVGHNARSCAKKA